MKSWGVTLLNLESKVAPPRPPRRRPLQTCGASFLAIAQRACTKVQELDEPLGSTAKSAITFVNSFVLFIFALLYPCLVLVSFIDDQILNIETKIESIFPRSTCLFDKINVFVCSVEALPESFDDSLKRFSLFLHHVPFLDWAINHLISWLNFIVSILTQLGSKNNVREKEKEITVDMICKDIQSCNTKSETEKNLTAPDIAGENGINEISKNRNESTSNIVDLDELVKSYASQERFNPTRSQSNEPATCEVIQKSVDRLRFLRNRIKILEDPIFTADSPMYASYQSADSSPLSDCSEGEISPFSRVGKSGVMNYSYKEMLERGQKEASEKKDEDVSKALVNEENGEKTDWKNSNEGILKSKF